MEQFREKRNGVLFVNTLTDEEYHSSTEAGLALKFSLYQKIETSLKIGYSHFYLYDPGWFEIYASDVLSVIKEYFPHMKVHLVLSKTYFAQYFFQEMCIRDRFNCSAFFFLSFTASKRWKRRTSQTKRSLPFRTIARMGF